MFFAPFSFELYPTTLNFLINLFDIYKLHKYQLLARLANLCWGCNILINVNT